MASIWWQCPPHPRPIPAVCLPSRSGAAMLPVLQKLPTPIALGAPLFPPGLQDLIVHPRVAPPAAEPLSPKSLCFLYSFFPSRALGQDPSPRGALFPSKGTVL